MCGIYVSRQQSEYVYKEPAVLRQYVASRFASVSMDCVTAGLQRGHRVCLLSKMPGTIRSEHSNNSGQIALSPVTHSHGSSFKHSEENVDVLAAGVHDGGKQRRRMYLVLIWITLSFLAINIVQIANIYKWNNIYWLAVTPALLLVICLLILIREIKKKWKGLSEVNEHPKCLKMLQQYRYGVRQ